MRFVFNTFTTSHVAFFTPLQFFKILRKLDQSRCSLHDRRFMSQAGRTRYLARSVTRARSARRGEEKNKAPVIVLDFCCIYIGLVFIKDSEIWVLRFRDRVLRFRDLGSSFSRFGVFVLRSSFSSASFSKLPKIFIMNRHTSKSYTTGKSTIDRQYSEKTLMHQSFFCCYAILTSPNCKKGETAVYGYKPAMF